MKTIGKYFFKGLLILLPAVVSLYIIFAIFRKIDRILGFSTPGIGFIVTLIFITVIGFFASNFITGRLVGYFEKLFSKLPIVKIFYSSIKDLVSAFVGDKKSFDKPVLVTMDKETGAKALAFITREELKFLRLRSHVAVYFPQSYNFAGNLLIYPSKSVKPIDADSAEVMKFLVSGGISGGGSN
ncbi:MAG: DUF502 domain-containing protein [Thermodesulfobacteriota bacterium]